MCVVPYVTRARRAVADDMCFQLMNEVSAMLPEKLHAVGMTAEEMKALAACTETYIKKYVSSLLECVFHALT